MQQLLAQINGFIWDLYKCEASLVRGFSDSINGPRATPNRIGMLGRSEVLAQATRQGLRQATRLDR